MRTSWTELTPLLRKLERFALRGAFFLLKIDGERAHERRFTVSIAGHRALEGPIFRRDGGDLQKLLSDAVAFCETSLAHLQDERHDRPLTQWDTLEEPLCAFESLYQAGEVALIDISASRASGPYCLMVLGGGFHECGTALRPLLDAWLELHNDTKNPR